LKIALKPNSWIVIEKGQGINILTICKYDTYNTRKDAEKTVEGQQKDSERTVKGRRKDKTNKDNKENKGNIYVVDSPEPTLFKSLVSYWLDVVHPDFDFNAVSGKALKSLIVKITKRLTNQGKEATDELIFDSFKAICENLPEWFQDKDLSILDSRFNDLIAQIKNKKNGTAQPTSRTSVYDSAAAFRPK
jgi:hypothetical protein